MGTGRQRLSAPGATHALQAPPRRKRRNILHPRSMRERRYALCLGQDDVRGKPPRQRARRCTGASSRKPKLGPAGAGEQPVGRHCVERGGGGGELVPPDKGEDAAIGGALRRSHGSKEGRLGRGGVSSGSLRWSQ